MKNSNQKMYAPEQSCKIHEVKLIELKRDVDKFTTIGKDFRDLLSTVDRITR